MAHKTSILEDGPDWLERKIQFIIEDGPKVLKSSQKEPLRDPVRNTRFLHLLAQIRFILEDGPDLAGKLARVSTGTGVGGRVNPPPDGF